MLLQKHVQMPKLFPLENWKKYTEFNSFTFSLKLAWSFDNLSGHYSLKCFALILPRLKFPWEMKQLISCHYFHCKRTFWPTIYVFHRAKKDNTCKRDLKANNKYFCWMHLPRPDRRPDALATWWATRWATRFSTWPKCENLVAQSGRLEQSGCPIRLASVRIYLRGPWYLPKRHNSNQIWSPRSDLIAHQVTGASGRRSGRGRCIQLTYNECVD